MKSKFFRNFCISLLVSASIQLTPTGNLWAVAEVVLPQVAPSACKEPGPTAKPPCPDKVSRTPSSEKRVWELSELVDEALKKNPELRAFRERWKAAKARVWKEMSWDDTLVGADFEGIPGGRFDPGRNNDIEWTIDQKIPFPGKRFLRGRVAAKEAKIAEADFRAKEREIITEVKKAYFEYFLREHEVRVHGKDTRHALDRLSKSAESRYATGQTPYSEVLRAHTELAILTNDIAKHYQQRDIALARLKKFLGRDVNEPFQITVSVPSKKFSTTKEDLMKLALENRPELRAMRYGLQAAKIDTKRAWLDLLPDGEFRVEARHFRGHTGIREYDQFYGFEVPVLSMLGRFGQIKEKRAESRAAEGALENMKNMVLLEAQEALAEFETNERTVKIYESSVIPQAESSVESGLAEYEAGRGNFLTVMEAQKALTEFRHEYFHSLAMREESFAELEKAVGIDLGGGSTK